MRIYTDKESALKAAREKETYFINSQCPHRADLELCGSWCAKFQISVADGNVSTSVVLGCKPSSGFMMTGEIV